MGWKASIATNGMAMVFNGLQQLVKRWDGNDPSLRSKMEWFILTEELPQRIWQKELQPTPHTPQGNFFQLVVAFLRNAKLVLNSA